MTKAKTAPKAKTPRRPKPPSTRRPPTDAQVAEMSRALPVTPALIAKKFAEPVGRPSVYKPEYVAVAYAHAASGGMDGGLADKLGVHVATIYKWRNEHPEFFDALKRGKLGFDQQVHDALLSKATGATLNKQVAIKLKDTEYDDMGKKLAERERVELVTVQEQAAPDTGAMIFWLTNRQGDDWKNTQRREMTGADGGAIDTSVTVTVNIGNELMQRLGRMSGRLTIDNPVTDVEPE